MPGALSAGRRTQVLALVGHSRRGQLASTQGTDLARGQQPGHHDDVDGHVEDLDAGELGAVGGEQALGPGACVRSPHPARGMYRGRHRSGRAVQERHG